MLFKILKSLVYRRDKLKNKKIADIVFIYTHRSLDERRLVKLGGKWTANGKDIIFKKALSLYFDNIPMTTTKYNELSVRMSKTFNHLDEIDKETYKFKAKFTKVGESKTLHDVYPESTKTGSSVGLATDQTKAQINLNYGKAPLINKFQGEKKPTTLLAQDTRGIVQRSEEKLVSVKNQYTGALENGYNPDLISIKYQEAINGFDDIADVIGKSLQDLGLPKEHSVDILKIMCMSMDSVPLKL